MDYKMVVERMAEEAGVKSLRKLDEAIGTPDSYVYAQIERGVSKGYLEKFISKYPDADLNYIFTGNRSKMPTNPREAVRALILQISGSEELADNMTAEYDSALDEAKRNLPRDVYLEETLRLVLRLLSIALEDE